MTLAEIRERPTTIGAGPNGKRVHESVMRSHSMLQKVRTLLMMETPVPPSVILEMIDDVMDAPGCDYETN
ncbi:MAG: hypothetical protein IT367_13875 [Candidatus Hydrogenedentes bacterium]|nr:hypothetical protein [Candidatus Hydrogenedentota bacterium]